MALATDRILALGALGRIPAQRQVFQDLLTLAVVLESGRDLPRAEAVFRLAASLGDPARDRSPGSTSGALLGLGRVLLAQGRHDEAAAVLERSLAIREVESGPLSYWLAPVLEELARVRRAQGRVDEAYALVARAAVLKATEGKAAAQVVAEALGQIGSMPAKLGQPQTDRHVIRVLARGSEAVSALVERLVSTEPSRFFYMFPYTQGDLAHRLLCELYRRPLLWPVADVTEPVGCHPEPTFMDYGAFVNAPHGRERLQERWLEVVRTVPLPAPVADAGASG
ncbi:MAG: tetratricopeptide repeat protein [Deltaproteobacteria bacterium]|nr:tetratricopeptide repeat protein [Deltaproteobacteria bacterium]